ncbi:hypothetical protein WM7_03034 [Enterococcus faecalis EnGen0361]|uniref:hypothetical protein n=1 Tax=Enterococcus faecalis TaxID=1351 RepID=UPI00032ED48C|nr:hypothetical protein [Enterococcus faecalis]EOJ44825.1 hypothetical protein WM7_03034 [Enterococcus faecalis EnGen0361]MBG4115747.1 hypothetical protein [Pseudomonas aeruginosa]
MMGKEKSLTNKRCEQKVIRVSSEEHLQRRKDFLAAITKKIIKQETKTKDNIYKERMIRYGFYSKKDANDPKLGQ